MSIDLTTLTETDEEAMQATKVKRHEDTPLEADNNGDKYDVGRTIRNKKDYEGIRYFVRWYGYRPSDITWESCPPYTEAIYPTILETTTAGKITKAVKWVRETKKKLELPETNKLELKLLARFS